MASPAGVGAATTFFGAGFFLFFEALVFGFFLLCFSHAFVLGALGAWTGVGRGLRRRRRRDRQRVKEEKEAEVGRGLRRRRRRGSAEYTLG